MGRGAEKLFHHGSQPAAAEMLRDAGLHVTPEVVHVLGCTAYRWANDVGGQIEVASSQILDCTPNPDNPLLCPYTVRMIFHRLVHAGFAEIARRNVKGNNFSRVYLQPMDSELGKRFAGSLVDAGQCYGDVGQSIPKVEEATDELLGARGWGVIYRE